MLRTTPEHPFFVEGQGWTPAGELQPGHLLSTATGDWLPVESITNTHQSVTVYNFRVSNYHTYFIVPRDAAFDVWVHNSYGVRGGLTTDRIRLLSGTAKGSDSLPAISGRWLSEGAGKLPGQIARQLQGQTFNNFKQFRETVWKTIAADPGLANGSREEIWRE